MIKPLDSTVSQVVFAAHLLEQAVHAPGVWTMAWGPHVVPVKRVLTDDSVILAAEFPAVCYLAPLDESLVLLLDGEVMDSRPMAHPGDRGFTVDWAIRGRLTTVSG